MIFLLLLLILSLLSSCPVYAGSYLNEEFLDSQNLSDNWIFVDGNESSENTWTVVNNRLNGTPSTNKYSYLILRKSLEDELYNFFVDFEVENRGGVDQPILLRRSTDGNTYYQIGIRYNEPSWSQDHNNITLRKKVNGAESLLASYSGEVLGNKEISQFVIHKIQIRLEDNLIRVFYDGSEVINYQDTSEDHVGPGSFGLLNWGGNCSARTNNFYDSLTITKISDKKIRIIIPGLGASWNTEGMLTGSTNPGLEWSMTPFVNNYDNLKQALEENGLVSGQDYFVWNYDWRVPVAQSVDRLDRYIDEKTEDGNTKVDIIGHSLGGLIGRLWAQQESDKSKIDKVITLGSPHGGAVSAYEAWNGASLGDDDSIGYIALKILLQLQRRNNISELSAIRSYVPVLKDLMPTFDYLKQNGKIINPATNQNTYLATANLNVSTVYQNLEAVGSNNQKTKQWINLGVTDPYDRVLGYWPQGKPVSYIYNLGDGTVLWTSSKFEDDSYSQVGSDHGALPDKSINTVMTKLGLDQVDIPSVATDYKGKAVFFLGSPARLKVDCGLGMIESDNFIVTDVKKGSECVLEVVGNGNGTYHLVKGKVGIDSSWNYYESETQSGQTDKYRFSGENMDLIGQGENVTKWWGEVEKAVGELKVEYPKYKFSEMEKQIRSKNAWGVVEEIFKLRGTQKEDIISSRAVSNLKNILLVTYTGDSVKAKKAQSQLVLDTSLCDRLTRLYGRRNISPDEFSAKEYKLSQAESLAANVDMQAKQYTGAEIKARLASYYVNNVWY